MCGRYTLTDPGDELIRHFQLSGLPAEYTPRYNIAPTQPVLAVIDADGRRAGMLRWGLIPGWAKDPAIGNRMINARAETLVEKPAFRSAFRRRRCLIPADGFYEWKTVSGRKQPYRIVRKDGGVFAFAGLWESWRPPGGADAAGRAQAADPADAADGAGAAGPAGAAGGRTGVSASDGAGDAGRDGPVIYTCTIITTDANETLQPIHHRMPVILSPEDYDLWLDRDIDDPEVLRPLLRPSPAGELRAYPVSTYVNNPRNEGPDCIAPLEETAD